MAIRDELLALRDDQGMLFVGEVVQWARDHPASSLHRALEWDDKKAAHAWRLEQVRQLIRVYVTTAEAPERMVSLSIDRSNLGGGYRSLSDIAARPDLRDILLQDALDELERVQAKYDRVQELATVWQEADAVREGSRKGRRRAVAAPEAATA